MTDNPGAGDPGTQPPPRPAGPDLPAAPATEPATTAAAPVVARMPEARIEDTTPPPPSGPADPSPLRRLIDAAQDHELLASAGSIALVLIVIAGTLWLHPFSSSGPGATATPARTGALNPSKSPGGSGAVPTPGGPVRVVGSLRESRTHHTATTLKSGKVLIAGGCDAAGHGLKTTELYDPDLGTFKPAAPMTTARCSHTATLLGDGRVMMIGGLDERGRPVATAELYDPAKDVFYEVDSMSTARFDHSTVIVAGLVLVAGGRLAPGGATTQTAELFDFSTAKFSMANPMVEPRAGAGAITLKDGRALFAGGDTFAGGKSTYVATAEIFVPKTRTFVKTSDMTTPRYHPAVVTNPSGLPLFIGGATVPGSTVATLELFDTSKLKFAEAGNMTQPREGEGLVLLKDGRLLITGGRIGDGSTSALAEICDLTTRTCKPIPNLPEARADHTATLLPDGAVLLVGGTTVGPQGTSSASASVRLVMPWLLNPTPAPNS